MCKQYVVIQQLAAASENFLTCIFLCAGLGAMDKFRDLHAHPILLLLISSWGDTLQDPCDLHWWTEGQNCSCDRREHLEGNWMPRGHLTCYERREYWSCLGFCSTSSTIYKTSWVTLSYSESSFICFFFRFENYRLWKIRQYFRITMY
jgi:hypothetical protein